jgi:hypothetical protein
VPVQGFGVVTKNVDGINLNWYFRARHASWRIEVGPESAERAGYVDPEDGEWFARGNWGHWPEAGCMEEEIARQIVVDALSRYLSGEPSWHAPDDLHYKKP